MLIEVIGERLVVFRRGEGEKTLSIALDESMMKFEMSLASLQDDARRRGEVGERSFFSADIEAVEEVTAQEWSSASLGLLVDVVFGGRRVGIC